MKLLGRSIVGGVAALLLFSPVSLVSAESLRIVPLEYQTTVKVGEKQKGYVDISNPEANTVEVGFEVQAFRQIDDKGNIEFYTDKSISSGIILDLDSVEMGPHEVLRLMFFIDGTKLPQGEVFAAILAHTVPRNTSGAAQSVRVGTILEITNGTPGAHTASIGDFSAPFFQFSDRVSAQFVVKNEDSTGGTGGFRPQLTFDVAPYSTKQVKGPLVFTGRSRGVAYSQPGNYFGFVWLRAQVGTSSAGSWAFVITGYWRWLAPMVFMALITLVIAVYVTRRKKH
jgi:hypothetical protein